jgi:hypothetical protein
LLSQPRKHGRRPASRPATAATESTAGASPRVVSGNARITRTPGMPGESDERRPANGSTTAFDSPSGCPQWEVP